MLEDDDSGVLLCALLLAVFLAGFCSLLGDGPPEGYTFWDPTLTVWNQEVRNRTGWNRPID